MCRSLTLVSVVSWTQSAQQMAMATSLHPPQPQQNAPAQHLQPAQQEHKQQLQQAGSVQAALLWAQAAAWVGNHASRVSVR